jgi:hypothetical protein
LLDDVVKYQTVKLREEIARDSVVVAEEDLKFEHIEPPQEVEGEDSLARELGLDDSRHERGDRDEGRSRDDADDTGDAGEMGDAELGAEDDE